MTTINSCPFCGAEDVEIDEVRPGEYAVDCPECECIGPIKPEVMSAIKAWNGAPQQQYNRKLLAATKNLVCRITLDDMTLREIFSFDCYGEKLNTFDGLYQPLIDAANEAISDAEAA